MKKSNLAAKITAVILLLSLICIFAGCSGTAEDTAIPSTPLPHENPPTESFDEMHTDPSDYVDLGDYQGIEIIEDGLDLFVGDIPVYLPYYDESAGTELALKYYYSQVSPDENSENWEIPSDQDVAQAGIPEIHSFAELKDYVLQKANENDEITAFIRIGDAFMEQVVANASFGEVPQDVITVCNEIYADYLNEMLSRYNEIGEIPAMPTGENSAHKVLAAMAIAKETGISMDAFDYEEVLKQLIA